MAGPMRVNPRAAMYAAKRLRGGALPDKGPADEPTPEPDGDEGGKGHSCDGGCPLADQLRAKGIID